MSTPEIEGHGRGARLHAELLEDVGQMGLDGGEADVETFADVAVGPAAAQEIEHFALPRRQGVAQARCFAGSAPIWLSRLNSI